jgi:hypothetical protein
VAKSGRLPGRAAAVKARTQVEGAFDTGDPERRCRRRAVREAREVVLEGSAVDPRRPVAGTKNHAGYGGLPLAGAEVLCDLAHRS